jgi:hypothetical protein
MLERLRLICLLVFSLVIFSGCSKETPVQSIELGRIASDGLSAEQARKILDYVLEYEKVKPNLPHTFIEDGFLSKNMGSPFSKYYTFVLYHSDPNAAALSKLGWFAVSKDTGDVFEINTCKRDQ